MKNFTVCYNKEIQGAEAVKDTLAKLLSKKGLQAQIADITSLPSCLLARSHETGLHGKAQHLDRSALCSLAPPALLPSQFVFVIGGDGTILRAGRFFAKSQTPIFGINLGRLGFLSQTCEKELENSVQKILDGKYRTEERIMLASGDNTALNDFVVKSCVTGRTSKFLLKINGKPVCDYLADGLIISTPTGSTAYGLSAGGPVLTPELEALVIVPICPHTLTARPLVVPDSEKITVCIKDNGVASADGQEFYEFSSEIKIEKSEYSAKLALLEDTDFYSVLRSKLHWGISPVK